MYGLPAAACMDGDLLGGMDGNYETNVTENTTAKHYENILQ